MFVPARYPFNRRVMGNKHVIAKANENDATVLDLRLSTRGGQIAAARVIVADLEPR